MVKRFFMSLVGAVSGATYPFLIYNGNNPILKSTKGCGYLRLIVPQFKAHLGCIVPSFLYITSENSLRLAIPISGGCYVECVTMWSKNELCNVYLFHV